MPAMNANCPADVLKPTSHAPALHGWAHRYGGDAKQSDGKYIRHWRQPGVAFHALRVLSARMIYMPAATRLRQDVDGRRSRHHFRRGYGKLAGKRSPIYKTGSTVFTPKSKIIFGANVRFRRPTLNSRIAFSKARPRRPLMDDWLITYAE
jgi:hypothetical protein